MVNVSLNTLKQIIQAEVIKLIEDRDYYGSLASEANENYILKLLKERFGYDYELDDEMQGFCIHASQIEIWECYLEHIIPKLKPVQ